MKLLKFTIFFIVSFFISWAVIATLSQPLFTDSVPIRFITYTSPKIPIYYYVAFAFFAGLTIGLSVAFYNFILLKKELFKHKRELQKLEKEKSDFVNDTVNRLEDNADNFEDSYSNNTSPDNSKDDTPLYINE